MQIHNPAALWLGRKPVRSDSRTLKLARYMTPKSLPALPASVDWGTGIIDWGMMLNDQYGDCTAAGAGHLFKLWNDKAVRQIVIHDTDILAFYELCTAAEGAEFAPGPPPLNDNGCAELDVLKQLKSIGFAGHKIDSYVSVNPQRHELIKAAIYFFGGCYIGVNLPLDAQNQGIWRTTDPQLHGDAAPGSWGGHCVILTAYDDNGLTCITWGQEKRLTWDWLDAYCDEAYALLAQDWLGTNAVSPGNFNMAQLTADLAQLAAS